jgi:hypothetical protein
MKANYLFVLAFIAMLFMACSAEEMDPVSETAALELNDGSTKAVPRPFKVRGSGSFEVVAPTECVNLAQIDISGEGNATHLGRFNVEITYCTDFMNTQILTGTQTAANGDELYFYSVGFGVDEEGEWTDYVYDGGTGRFEFATGELRLYGVSTFTGPTTGVYTNHGEGTLTY